MSKENKKFPYEFMNRMYDRISAGQDFGRPTLTKYGKKIDIYDMIQEAREDTEIIPTLEKYGCLDRMQIDDNVLYGDMTELMKNGLRGIMENEQKADDLWNSLPWEYREQFQNNRALFLENGEQWLKDKIEKAKQSTTGEQKGETQNA